MKLEEVIKVYRECQRLGVHVQCMDCPLLRVAIQGHVEGEKWSAEILVCEALEMVEKMYKEVQE